MKKMILNARWTRVFGLILLLLGSLSLLLVLYPLLTESSRYYSPVLLCFGTFLFLMAFLFLFFPGKHPISVREIIYESDGSLLNGKKMKTLDDISRDLGLALRTQKVPRVIYTVWGIASLIFSIYWGFFFF